MGNSSVVTQRSVLGSDDQVAALIKSEMVKDAQAIQEENQRRQETLERLRRVAGKVFKAVSELTPYVDPQYTLIQKEFVDSAEKTFRPSITIAFVKKGASIEHKYGDGHRSKNPELGVAIGYNYEGYGELDFYACGFKTEPISDKAGLLFNVGVAEEEYRPQIISKAAAICLKNGLTRNECL